MATPIHAGWCVKRGAVNKNWKSRFFVLRDDLTLSYFKDAKTAGKPKGMIDLRNATSLKSGNYVKATTQWPMGTDPAARFQVTTPERTFYMVAKTGSDAVVWLDKLSELTNVPATHGDGTQPSSTPVSRSHSVVSHGGLLDGSPSRSSLVEPPLSPELALALAQRLKAVAAIDANRLCGDCGAAGTTWAAWNIGVFLCMRCSGIHRGLGSHVSKVKSMTLDVWTPAQVAAVEAQSNAGARAVFEFALPADFVRPSADNQAAITTFIVAKYVDRKFCEDSDPFAAIATSPARNVGGKGTTADPFSAADPFAASPAAMQANFANFAEFPADEPPASGAPSTPHLANFANFDVFNAPSNGIPAGRSSAAKVAAPVPAVAADQSYNPFFADVSPPPPPPTPQSNPTTTSYENDSDDLYGDDDDVEHGAAATAPTPDPMATHKW